MNEEYTLTKKKEREKGEGESKKFFLTEKLTKDTREPLERDDWERRESERVRAREREEGKNPVQ